MRDFSAVVGVLGLACWAASIVFAIAGSAHAAIVLATAGAIAAAGGFLGLFLLRDGS
jgi:hypothetical protein